MVVERDRRRHRRRLPVAKEIQRIVGNGVGQPIAALLVLPVVAATVQCSTHRSGSGSAIRKDR